MSIQDATAVLQEDTGLFAFIPLTNCVFLLIQENTIWTFSAGLIATITASAIYTLIRGKPEAYSNTQTWIYRIIAVLWAVTLIWSMWQLHSYFVHKWIMPEILFFTSASFLTLLISDRLSDRYLNGYKSPL